MHRPPNETNTRVWAHELVPCDGACVIELNWITVFEHVTATSAAAAVRFYGMTISSEGRLPPLLFKGTFGGLSFSNTQHKLLLAYKFGTQATHQQLAVDALMVEREVH